MTQAELAALGQGTTVQPIPSPNSGLGGTLGGIYGAPQTGFFNNLPAGSPNMPGFGSIPTLPTGTPTGLTNNGNTIYASGMDNFSLNTPPVGGTTPVAPPQGQGTSSGTSVPVNTNSPYAYGRPPDSPLNQFNSATGLPNPNWNGANTGGATGTGDGTTAPAGSVANLYQTTVNPDQAQLDAMYGIINDTSQITDPNQIYNNTLAQYQAQIDATNAMFADQLNNARIQGQGRIESRQFAQGRAGQIGSGTGEAGINAVQDANNQVTKSIQAEQAAAIQSILTQTKNEAAAILKANTEAKKAGAQATLEFLNVTKPALKKKATVNAISSLIAKGITELTPEELKSYTDGLGITEGEFTKTWDEVINQQVAEMNKQAKADAELAKTIAETANIGIPVSAQEYNFAKANGYTGSYAQYQNEDANRKAAGMRSPTQQDYITSAVSAIGGAVAASQDANGFLTPSQYQQLKDQWVNQTGLPLEQFDAHFANKAYLKSTYKESPYSEAQYGLPVPKAQ